jgi:hypothetical protein
MVSSATNCFLQGKRHVRACLDHEDALDWILVSPSCSHGIELVISIHFHGSNSWPASHSEQNLLWKPSESMAPSSRLRRYSVASPCPSVDVLDLSKGSPAATTMAGRSAMLPSTWSEPRRHHGVFIVYANHDNPGNLISFSSVYILSSGAPPPPPPHEHEPRPRVRTRRNPNPHIAPAQLSTHLAPLRQIRHLPPPTRPQPRFEKTSSWHPGPDLHICWHLGPDHALGPRR